jgi:outer membrane protein TolC
MLQKMLSTFCGIEIKTVQKPSLMVDGGWLMAENRRPELKALDAQLGLLNAQEHALNSALMPKLGVFAQGYYGYPGLNMFEDMMSHQWSLNGIIGARLTWNIGALYTRKNDKAKINSQRSMVDVQRETFLFNNNLEQIQQNENISRYKKLMADDEEIISLRSAVRKAAESKLSHGIIDVNDLVREINQENAARVSQSMHEIEMLKEIYDNKFTTNN